MKFNPNLKYGDTLTNGELRELFQCGNMGGMRRSKKTGTLVIISDETKGLYRDEWKNGVFYYTGMGKSGDQQLRGNQNITLFESRTNGIEVHLFEVEKKAIYTYTGIVELAAAPYQDEQPDVSGHMRKVWIFPLKMANTSEENVKSDALESFTTKLSNEELFKKIKKNSRKEKATIVERKEYYRDPNLKEYVKRIADGWCQCCKKQAPFEDRFDVPYLEEHHVKALADGGSDTMDNVVALCPNCHRKIHVLGEKKDILMLERQAKKNAEEMLRRQARYMQCSVNNIETGVVDG